MLSSLIMKVWTFVQGYARWNDVYTLFVAGILAAGLTLPADGQNWREWAFSVATIMFNVGINAVRRARATSLPLV
jgi:hypothetical protein